MGKYSYFLRVEAVLHEFVFGKTAGGQEVIDAPAVSSQPAMEIGFGHQEQRGTRRPGVTTLGENVPEPSATTALARMSFGYHVVGGAKQLEIVQMIEHRDALRLEFPENRRGQVVIDVAHVRNVGMKISDHPTQSPASVSGIEGMRRVFHTRQQSMGMAFEINVWQEVMVVGCGLAARIRHREKCDFMPLSSQQIHELEHVNFGATKRKIVFIAEQDSHKNCAPRVGRWE